MEKLDKCVFTAKDDIEASMIEELLGNNRINSFRKYKGSSSYLKIFMGTMSTIGVQICVSEENFKEADALIQAFFSNNNIQVKDLEE